MSDISQKNQQAVTLIMPYAVIHDRIYEGHKLTKHHNCTGESIKIECLYELLYPTQARYKYNEKKQKLNIPLTSW